MLRCFTADLHIHTCLSPCADGEMRPNAIVRAAKARSLDVIGICDHNSAENVQAVKNAAREKGLAALGGIEVSSREEVHVLALFDDDAGLQAMQQTIYENLPGKNDRVVFGEQLVCDEDDSIVGRNRRMLIGAADLTIEQVVEAIHGFGGIAVASHIDRAGSGILGHVGSVLEGLKLDALELSLQAEERQQWRSQARGLPLLAFSDAHRLAHVGTASTSFVMESVCVKELFKALNSQGGRMVVG